MHASRTLQTCTLYGLCQYTFMSHRALCCGHLYHATYKAILIPCIWLGNWNRAHKLQICSIGSELKKMEFKRDDYQLSKSYTYSLNIRPWATNLSDLGHLRMSICRKSFKIRDLFTHDWTVCACHTQRYTKVVTIWTLQSILTLTCRSSYQLQFINVEIVQYQRYQSDDQSSKLALSSNSGMIVQLMCNCLST